MKYTAEWATFVVAVIALIQPWLIWLWNKYIKRPRIEFHESGKVEVGYSSLGPTIAIMGTFRAVNRDIFVRDIKIRIVKEKNKSQYEFSMIAFRSTTLSITNLKPVDFKVPSGFLVRQDLPFTVFPVFNDKETLNEISAASTVHAEKMIDFEHEYFKSIPNYSAVGNSLLSQEQKKEFADAIKSKPFNTDFFVRVDRLYYWDEGNYEMIIDITSSKNEMGFSKSYKFHINKDQSDLLKLNSVYIVNTSSDQFQGKPESVWNFIYSDYLD